MATDTQRSDRPQAGDELHETDLKLALDAARTGAWRWDPATGALSCSRRMREICGISRDAAMTFELFLSHIRAEHRSRTRETLLQTCRDGSPGRIECELADSSAGLNRWIILEGRPYAIAGSGMRMLGTVRDISSRKRADAQNELAAREMDHRIQNVFTVMTSVVALSERFAGTPRQLAHSLEARIGALARAQGLLQKARSGAAVALQDVVEGELAAFTDLSQVSIHGAHISLKSRQAWAMNMIMHELTTNAVKHGALSRPGGQLSVDWTVESSMRTDCIVLRWKEHCSQPIAPPPLTGGLGLRLLKSSARTGLRGDILMEFESTGLLATLVAPVSHPAERHGA